jgi:nucleotide-binding universal stress UspA family protein
VSSPIRKILVFIDGTESSITAAQYAICLARHLRADLTAFYVINTRAMEDLLKARIFLREMEYTRDLEADAKRYLNHVRELARSKGLAIETKSAQGSVHQEILKQIKEDDIDLLIIGELSRIRSRRDEFYNDTERAMRSSNCSVLIVKDEERVWQQFDQLC